MNENFLDTVRRIGNAVMVPARNMGKTVSVLTTLAENPCHEIAYGNPDLCRLAESVSVMRYIRVGGEMVLVGGWVDFRDLRR